MLVMCVLSAYGQRTVYICTGSGAYKYHYSRDCRGLNNCTAEIEEISEEKAISNPKYVGLCKICGKHKRSVSQVTDEGHKPENPIISQGQQNDPKSQGTRPQKKSKLGIYKKYNRKTK